MSLEELGRIRKSYIPFLRPRFVLSGWVACDADVTFHQADPKRYPQKVAENLADPF